MTKSSNNCSLTVAANAKAGFIANTVMPFRAATARERMLLLIPILLLQSCHATNDISGVRGVLDDQVAAWNRGDLIAFVDGYDQNAIFVGAAIARGKAGVLERYQKNYGTAEKRGSLEFTDLEIKPIGRSNASVIGRFHLKRTPSGGGDAKGIFSLLFEKREQGWKIILDHTS